MRRIWERPNLRGFFVVFSANAANNVVAFVLTIHAARIFGPAQFGTLAVAMSVTSVLAMILDCGLSIVLVRELNVSWTESDCSRLPALTFRIKFFILFGVAAFFYEAKDRAANLILPGQGQGWLLFVAAVSSGLLSVWMSIRALEQARKKFSRFSAYTYVYAFLRLACYAGFLLARRLTVITAIASLYILPLTLLLLIGCLEGSIPLSIPASDDSRGLRFSRLFHYGAWVAVSSIVYMATLRAPQFVLAHEADRSQLGLFSAALTFTAALVLLNDSMRTIVLPEAISRRTGAERDSFRAHHRRTATIFFAAATAGLITAVAIQYFFLGTRYREAIPIFVIMWIAVSITIFFGLANTLIHSVGLPRYDTVVNSLRFIALLAVLAFVPHTAMAAALAFSIVLVCGELVLYLLVRAQDRPKRVPDLLEGADA